MSVERRALIAFILTVVFVFHFCLNLHYQSEVNELKHQIELRDKVNERNKAINDSLMRIGKDYEYKK